ncbi:MAG: hypothetical protein KGN33_15090, partial [Paracoccaceae bacterium]|nr:hypothetical protein [Paracoccaceae bacterium]
MVNDFQKIEDELIPLAKGIIEASKDNEPIRGWRSLFEIGFSFQEYSRGKIPVLTEQGYGILLHRAATEPNAFDAATYVAGMSIAAQHPIPPSLLLFASRVLTGEVVRPKQRGRPVTKNIYFPVFQYFLIIFVAKKYAIQIGRSTDKKAGRASSLSACDIVANAFSRAGRKTPYSVLRSICYDDS